MYSPAAAAAVVLMIWAISLLAVASAEVIEHTFNVHNFTVERLCRRQEITGVNGGLPGPTIRAKEGDTLAVHVLNNSPYNVTIHWHGVLQQLSGWADGPAFVTQCPITPGQRYTYRFNVRSQEGTLWWHAHSSVLRATVHGALVILPSPGRSYPFPTPYDEFTVLLGEWWNANVIDVEKEAIARGGAPNISDAFTINGYPGDLYRCSSTSRTGTYRMKVIQGKTYLLRIINAALNTQLFFKIADHSFKVVAVDAAYTTPYDTDVVVVAPGQTADVLLNADQPPANYSMAARPYASAANAMFDNTTTTGVLEYQGAVLLEPSKMPELPLYNDTPTAHRFYSNLTGLVTGPFWSAPPCEVDEKMLITVGLGLVDCGNSATACSGGISGRRLAASMNNASFQLPTKLSLLEASVGNVNGVYDTDFPDQPPVKFDYTNVSNSLNATLLTTVKSTRVRKVKFNSTVEIVFQNTALVGAENHPMHLHGFNFYVLAQGFGNYNPSVDPGKFNLFSPQQRNTIAVPAGGWAAIRFRADNPGVWLLHCHLDVHLSWGLSTAIVVENGQTPSTKLPPPPLDLPKCELSTGSGGGVEIPYLLLLKVFISSLVCYGVMRTCVVLTRARSGRHSGYKKVAVHQ